MRAIGAAALVIGLLTAPFANSTAVSASPRIAATTCTKLVGDYQYATASPTLQRLTATTLSCRRNAPWVLTIHGGSWINGTRVNSNPEVGLFFQHGWQAFNMDYRRGPEVTWAMQKSDLVAAFNWVRARARQFGIDPRRSTAFGYSSGGQMAAWVGVLTPVADVVSVGGVLQPQRVVDDDNGLRPKTEPPTAITARVHAREMTMMGCDWTRGMSAQCRATWNAFDPETALTAASAPGYLMQGDLDVGIYPPTVDAYAYHMGQVRVPHVEVHVANLGHTNQVLFGSVTRERAMLRWVAAR